MNKIALRGLTHALTLALIAVSLLLFSGSAAQSAQGTTLEEDFENGNFSRLDWQFDEERAEPWIVSNEEVFDGDYAARAGEIGHNGVSRLHIPLDFVGNGVVRFYYRVSSEPFDALRFFIDDEEVGKWSGISGWDEVTFRIPPGSHTLRWEYTKDSSVSEGEDTAWIDNVTFQGVRPPEADLQVRIVVGPNNIIPQIGDQFPFGINVENNGPDDAFGITLVGIDPEALGLSILSVEGLDPLMGLSLDPFKLSIPVLEAGESATAVLNGLVEDENFALDDLVSSLSLLSTVPDPLPDNNPLEATVLDIDLAETLDDTTEPLGADLGLIMVSDLLAQDAVLGDQFELGFTACNNGPSEAHAVDLSTDLNAIGLEILDVVDVQTGQFNPETGTLSVGVLPVGECISLTTLVEVVADDFDIHNLFGAAKLVSLTTDPILDNNLGTLALAGDVGFVLDDIAQRFSTSGGADLGLIVLLEEELSELNVGSTLIGAISVCNAGPGSAHDVIVDIGFEELGIDLLEIDEIRLGSFDLVNEQLSIDLLPAGECLSLSFAGLLTALISEDGIIGLLELTTMTNDPILGNNVANLFVVSDIASTLDGISLMIDSALSNGESSGIVDEVLCVSLDVSCDGEDSSGVVDAVEDGLCNTVGVGCTTDGENGGESEEATGTIIEEVVDETEEVVEEVADEVEDVTCQVLGLGCES